MGIRQSGARNAGTSRLLEQRIRLDGESGGDPIAYDNGGLTQEAPGDDEALWVKGMPFPSLEAGWGNITFSNEEPQPEGTEPFGEYVFLPELAVDGVRKLLVWLDLQGLADEVQTSTFSLVPGAVLQGNAPLEERFFPLPYIDQPSQASDVILDPPLLSAAKSKVVMPSEFRTEPLGNVATARRVRFTMVLDVSPYTRVSLAIAELSEAGSGFESFATVRYSYSM